MAKDKLAKTAVKAAQPQAQVVELRDTVVPAPCAELLERVASVCGGLGLLIERDFSFQAKKR